MVGAKARLARIRDARMTGPPADPDERADIPAPIAIESPATGASATIDPVELLRRERADFINYRRRVDAERALTADRVRAELVEWILPIIDELDRAFAQLPDRLASDPWVRGVALSRERLSRSLSELGVDRIGREGDLFDPTAHEALSYETRPDAVDQRVASVIEPGYRVGQRLLRPARVMVIGPAANDRVRGGDGQPGGLRDQPDQGESDHDTHGGGQPNTRPETAQTSTARAPHETREA